MRAAQGSDIDFSTSLSGLLLDFCDGSAELLKLVDKLDRASADARATLTLEAFLLAAGLNQIVDEALHRPVPLADRAARAAPRRFPPGIGAIAGRSFAGMAAGTVAVRERRQSQLNVRQWQVKLLALIDGLVDDLVTADTVSRPLPENRHEAASAFLAVARDLPPAVRRTVVRPPTCFQRLDQRPADMFRLTREVARRRPDQSRPVLVIGIRTSGSYLAPLYAGGLRRVGFSTVEWLSIRANERRLKHERERVRQAVACSALVLIADDPPRTGGQLDQVARDLIAVGVRRENVVLLLTPLGPASSVPPRLGKYDQVLLEWNDWEIHSRLHENRVRAELVRQLEGRRITVPTANGAAIVAVKAVTALEPLPRSAESPTRGHVRRVFRFTFLDEKSVEREHHAVVEGAGLGRFALPWLQAKLKLGEFFSEIYGVADGLLYRSAIPDHWTVSQERFEAAGASIAAGVAAYVAARRRETRVASDVSARARDGRAVWERCSKMLSTAFGSVYMRPVVEAATRRLLRVDAPSLPDGAVAAPAWAHVPGTSNDALRKSRLSLTYSCDASFSLALAASDRYRRAPSIEDARSFAAELLREYERLTGEDIPDERWLLYQLLDHWEHLRGLREAEEVLRTQAAIEHLITDYLSHHYLSDLPVQEAGPLCAIDIDGVLESRWLSAPSTTPLGALALRALNRHRHRAVLASGRSVSEVGTRCRAYRLAGAAAEYGAAIYVSAGEKTVSLLSDAERQDLARVRGALHTMSALYVDARYEHAIRAYQIHPDGELTGLRPAVIQSVLDETGLNGAIRAVEGGGQTDFIPVTVTKGAGLLALAAELSTEGDDSPPPIALAVGNSTSDISMFAVAHSAALTANASSYVRAAVIGDGDRVRLLRNPMQAGLLEAVEGLLGHRVSGCETCAAPRSSGNAALLLALLTARSTRRQTKLREALRLATSSLRPRIDPHAREH